MRIRLLSVVYNPKLHRILFEESIHQLKLSERLLLSS